MDILSKNAEPAGVTTAGKNTEEGARTLDLWIHNPVLYQLSYLGIREKPKHFILRHPNSEAKTSPSRLVPSGEWRARNMRTPAPMPGSRQMPGFRSETRQHGTSLLTLARSQRI